MKSVKRVIGWTREQWLVALHFYDTPCQSIEEFLACRLYWWAHWDNPPSTAQLYFTQLRNVHAKMVDTLFDELAPPLPSGNLESDG